MDGWLDYFRLKQAQPQSCPLPGDHWRKRHEILKNTLLGLCQWAGLPYEVEVLSLFKLQRET